MLIFLWAYGYFFLSFQYLHFFSPFIVFHCVNKLSFHFGVACKNIEHIGFKDPIFLEELHIDGCENLMKLAINNVEGDLTTLRTVHLDNISLLIPYCKQLVSLEELVIDGKGQTIDSLDELPNSSIRKLCLIRCQNESFFTKGEYKERPKDMEEFKSLKCLHLKQCYKMKSLPYLPYNLDELRIDECPLLEKHCRRDGPGLSSISHVPYKYIWPCEFRYLSTRTLNIPPTVGKLCMFL